MFGPRKSTGPSPSLRVAELLLVVARRVGGVADVHGDADGRMDAVGAGRRAAQADLFLHGRDAIDRGLQRPAVQQPQRFHHGPDADLVVHGRRRDQAVAQRPTAQIEVTGSPGVTSSSASLRSLAPMSTQMSVNCGTLLRSSLVSRCGALRETTPVMRPALGPDGQVLAEQDLHVPAADRLDVEEAVVVDVLHHQGDLIAVPGQHDARPAAPGLTHGDDVAVPIGADLVGERPGPGADHVLDGVLEAGRAGRLQQVFEKTKEDSCITVVSPLAAMKWSVAGSNDRGKKMRTPLTIFRWLVRVGRWFSQEQF